MNRKVNTTALFIGLLAVSVAPAFATTGKTEALPRSGQAIVGEQAPFLSGWTVENKIFNTAKVFKDESVEECALVFWATYCLPCLNGLKMLAAAEERFAERGIRIVLVNFSELPEKVQRFLTDNPQPYPVVLDRWQKNAKTYLADENGAVTLPRTVLIDRSGVVKAIFSTEGNDYVERILAGE